VLSESPCPRTRRPAAQLRRRRRYWKMAGEETPPLSKRGGKGKALLSNRSNVGDPKPKKATKAKGKKLATMPDGEEVLDLDEAAGDDAADDSPLAAEKAENPALAQLNAALLSNRSNHGDSKPTKDTKVKVKKRATMPNGEEVLDLDETGGDEAAGENPLAAENVALAQQNAALREELEKYKAELAALKSIAMLSGDLPLSLRERLMGPHTLPTDRFC